ncbi:thioredoxin [Amorphus sp. MBR-141]
MSDTPILLGSDGRQIASATPAGAGAAAGDGVVIDATTQTFARDVLEASRAVPVLVDFWAPWCGPCKQLTPILEKVVREAGGTVRLVKLNIDDDPQIAQQLGIQSIPAVIAFKDGRPVDGFMGALPEGQVKQFVEQIAGPGGPGAALAEALAQADALRQSGELQGAVELYLDILQQDPGSVEAIAGLALCQVEAGDVEDARQTLAMIPEELAGDPNVAAVHAAIALADEAAEAGDAAALEAQVQANPDDHQARFDLAVALAGSGAREKAVEHLLAILRADREWNDAAARTKLLSFFEVWGPKDPATIVGRRKMSSLLFS